MTKSKGWTKESKRHSLASRGIKTNDISQTNIVTPTREYFFIDNKMYVTDPVKYLNERYGVPDDVTKSLTLLIVKKNGKMGFDKDQLDAFGQEFNERNEEY